MDSSLCDIKPGESAVVISLTSKDSMRRRLLDIGLIENTRVECVGTSPLGDPSAFLIRGAVIAIRSEDSRNIMVKKLTGGSTYGIDKKLNRHQSSR